MGIVDPLLTEHGTVIRCDRVILVTQEQAPIRVPNYAVLITQEESTADVLMVGLSSAELFGVRCDMVRLGPRYPLQPSLLGFPDILPGDKVGNPDCVVLLLWEECPSHRQQ